VAGTLLERERETAALDALLDGAADGRPGLALIEGPAGAGKSRLLEAAAERAERRGVRLLRARGVELERAFSFGVARQLVEPLLAGADDDERARLLAGPAGLAGSLLAGDAAAASIAFGSDHRHALAHGLRSLLANAARARPLAVLVDDAHWADEPSLAFLAALAARLDLPLALIVALRPGEPGVPRELLDQLRAAPGAAVLTPAPLGAEAVARFVEERLLAATPRDDRPRSRGGRRSSEAAGSLATARASAPARPAPEFVAACEAATGGNPFLLAELLEEAAADGLAPTAAAAERVRELVPETVLRAMLVRLRRLSAEAVALARAAAVLGERAPLSRVASLAAIEPDAAAAAADRLAAAHLLAGGEPVGFVHPLVAGAVLADIPAHARARMHGRAARLLAGDGEPAEAVAAHLLYAAPGCWDGAGQALVAGARAALRRGDYAAGQRLLARALREPLPPRERADAEITAALAEVARGAADVTSVERALSQVRDPARRVEAHLAVALRAYLRKEYEPALAAIERGLREPRVNADDDGLATLRDLRTAAAALAPGRVRERGRLGEGIDLDDPAQAARAPITLAVRASTAATRGASPAEVRALAAKVPLERLEVALLPTAIGVAFATTALLWSDELDAAEAMLAVALPAVRDGGSLTAFGSLSHLRALVRLRQGRLAEAIADGQPGLELRREGWETYRGWTGARLAVAHLARGELAEAEALVAIGMGGDPTGLDHAFVLEAAGEVALARGDAATALAHQLAAGELVERWQLRHPGAVDWQASAALAALRVGEAGHARALADGALAHARAVGAPRPLARALRAQAAVVEQGGHATARLGGRGDGDGRGGDAAARDGGLALLEEAVAVLRPTRLALEFANALVDLGARLRRNGAPRAARAPLREGMEIAERCTAAPLATRAHEELRATGGRKMRARPLAGPDALTPSERRVAELAAAGAENAAIAGELVVTVKTVEWHLSRVYRKLGIASRRELAGALGAARA
jgi:DNA-binding CsgD family transcriptional regulator